MCSPMGKHCVKDPWGSLYIMAVGRCHNVLSRGEAVCFGTHGVSLLCYSHGLSFHVFIEKMSYCVARCIDKIMMGEALPPF